MFASRNDPCPCGSGKKYKKCCLREQDMLTVGVSDVRGAQERAEGLVQDYAAEVYGEECLDDAWEEFVGEAEVEYQGPEMQLFVPWVQYDWKPAGDPKKRSLAAAYLEERGNELRDAERHFLETTLAAAMGFHDVVEVFPGRGVTTRDILSGAEHFVAERSGSQTLQVGDILFARVVPFGPYALMIGTGSVPFPPLEKATILGFRKALGKSAQDPRLLKELLPEMKTLYFEIAHRLMHPAPPHLCNTDGDPLEFHTLTYRIESHDETFEALKPLAWGLTEDELTQCVEPDKDGEFLSVKFPWRVKGNKANKSWDNTILGHFEIDARNLKVTVNSAKRAARIRKEINKRLGNQATFMEDVASSLEAELEKERSPKEKLELARAEEEHERLNAQPEVQAMMKQFMERHWESWIDEKIPALSGKTPRQAVRDPDGREMVEALLLDSERRDRKRGVPPVDYQVIRARLGLKPE